MKITFLGHASLSIEVEDVVILVDPFISGNPKASQIDVNTLNKLNSALQDSFSSINYSGLSDAAVLMSTF